MSEAGYKSQAARDAEGLYRVSYCEYLEKHAIELAAKFPDRADYFMNQSLGEALAGNDGN